MPPPPRAALADLAAVVPAGRACLLCRLPTLPFILLLPPIPPTRARRALFPGGEGGESKFSYARGFAPCIPDIRPPAALTEPAAVVSGGEGVLNPGGTCFPCPGGEDHLKRRRRLRRIVPLPRSPLSLAAGTAHREPLPVVFAGNRRLLAQGARLAETVSAANGLMQGCRGLRPRRNKLWGTPFPTGEGGGGIGGRKEGKGRGQQAASKASPRRVPQRQGQQVPQTV